MTSPDDVPPLKPPPSFSLASPLPTKSRYSDRLESSKPLSALSESTLNHSSTVEPHSAASSRASSPDRRLSRSSLRFSRSSTLSPPGSFVDGSDDIRSIIIRGFAPVIGIYATPDTDALIQRKGFKGGFHELVRPFGEQVTGKVVIRDGIGSSRSWDDYGVRFAPLNGENETPEPDTVSPLTRIEQVLGNELEAIDGLLGAGGPDTGPLPQSSPSLFKLFLRRLLSSSSLTPHETFLHPVACVIAISSRTPSPLESLRQLYADASHGEKRPPPWVNPEFLRYYVLVHDEDRDDIGQSTALFDQMKRHFGLHCHLLRLRSNQCVITDDDSIQFPSCEWLTAREDITGAKEQEPLLDVESEVPYIFESDVTAIKSFVRELVAQSVIPHMENRVAIWNDQVASRRRGISGRFMSMSKRWASFGATARSPGAFGSATSNENYDPIQGFYKPDSPEATLRKMADYAFMLRDWKLASSTYELLKSDFANDKAWKYHAGAHEMCAISTLLNPLSSSNKSKLEPIDQMLETACYSYYTRCSDSFSTLRTLVLGVELLKSRGGAAAEGAARWGMRASDMHLLGNFGRVLIFERISACYASKVGIEGAKWGTRRRKAGMWSVLAAERWLKLKKPNLASACLEEADRCYGQSLDDGILGFQDVEEFVGDLRRTVKAEYLEAMGTNGEDEEEADEITDLQDTAEETKEQLDHRSHRRSLIGGVNPLDISSLPLRLKTEEEKAPNDDFE